MTTIDAAAASAPDAPDATLADRELALARAGWGLRCHQVQWRNLGF